MENINELKSVIKTVVNDQFRNLRIVDINIEPETDEYEEPYYYVEIIFDADAEWPETEIRVGLVGHMRPKLEANGFAGFPVLSFIPNSEYQEAEA